MAGFTKKVVPSQSVVYHVVDFAPSRETADVAVVNPQVDFQLAGEMVVVFHLLFGIVFVDGIELYTTFATPVDCIVKKLVLANAP